MALVGPRVLNYLSESKVKTARIQIESFSQALTYSTSTTRYPTSSKVCRRSCSDPECGVVETVRTSRRLRACGPLGRPYSYRAPADHSPYEISSYGSTVKRVELETAPNQERFAIAARGSRRGLHTDRNRMRSRDYRFAAPSPYRPFRVRRHGPSRG